MQRNQWGLRQSNQFPSVTGGW